MILWQRKSLPRKLEYRANLECWLMNFTWNPVGIYSGYYFEIRVKAPELQDLKITKTGNFYNDK